MYDTHKTKMIGLPCGEETRYVTDRRTDRQTELLHQRCRAIKTVRYGPECIEGEMLTKWC